MSSASRLLTITLAGCAVWAGAGYTARATSPQERVEPFCGRVLSLTCASLDSDGRLMLEVSEGHFIDVGIAASLREDVMARLGEQYRQRLVCVTGRAAPTRLGTHIALRSSGQLTVVDDLAPVRGGSVFSTCDRSVQLPTAVRQVGPHYTPDAMRAGVQGTVTLHGIVEATGQITDIRVVHALDEGLDTNAREAFAQWQFRPALRFGKVVAVAVTGDFEFHAAPARYR